MSTVKATISAFESLTTNPDPIDFLESPPPAMVKPSLQPIIAASRPSPSPSPPGLGRKTSLIDLKDWVVDDGAFHPLTRSSSSHTGISQLKSTNSTMGRSQKSPSSPTTTGGNVPLIDLHSPLKPKPKPKPKPAILAGTPTQAATKQPPPQLPPRKASHTSLKSTAASSPPGPQLNFLYPPRRQDSLTDQRLESLSKTSGHAQSSSISSFHSVSLSSDTDTSRPGSVANFIATFPIERGLSSSSANSAANDIDSISLTESYEEVSTSSLASPATEERIEWQYAARKPPKLPERSPSTNSSIKASSQASLPRKGSLKATAGSGPSSPVVQPSFSRHSSVSTLNNAAPPYSPYTPRRAAPPPPPSRSSDRSSILSTQSFSSHSSHSHQQPPPPLPGAPTVALKIKRPTPVPLAARKRYETVFVKNVLQQRKARKAKESGLLSPPSEVARNRRAAGWRGLSVDLIVDPEGPTTNGAQSSMPQSQRNKGAADEAPDHDEILEGAIVRLIWKKSGLDSTRLAEIWNECDPAVQGALNLDGFVKGMWRIDEELRRTQAQMLKSTSTNSLGLYRQSIRSPPAKLPRYKDILR